MPAGIQCWDAAGNLTLDMTDRIVKVLGVVDTGTGGGSIWVPGFSAGTGWFYAAAVDGGMRASPPTTTINGNTLSWLPSPENFRLTYGVY